MVNKTVFSMYFSLECWDALISLMSPFCGKAFLYLFGKLRISMYINTYTFFPPLIRKVMPTHLADTMLDNNYFDMERQDTDTGNL